MTDFSIVHGEVTARHISNLAEGLAFTPDFEQQIVVNQEVTLLWTCHIVLNSQLALEVSFTLIPLVNVWTKGVHQIRIVKVYLVWLDKGLIIFCL